MENNENTNVPESSKESGSEMPNNVPPVEFSNAEPATSNPLETEANNAVGGNTAPDYPQSYPAPAHTELYQQGSYEAAPAGYEQQNSQAGAFGNYAQQPPQPPYGGYGSGWGNDTNFYNQPVKQARKPVGKTAPLVVAVALVAALTGGGIGGSIVAANNHNNGGTSVSSSASQVISTSNEKTVSDLSAVVTKGLKSVVTVSSVGSSETGTGSGVVLNASDGYIVTNAHVATLEGETDNATLTVQTSTGNTYSAKLVGYDATADIAVLKVSDTMKGVEDIKFASSDDLAVGTGTIAIGAPLGLSGTVTTGIISALDRPITVASSEVNNNSDLASPYGGLGGGNGSSNGESTQTSSGVALNVIQTDASINPGNSGGALLDDNGNLIGINVAIASTSTSDSSSQSGSVGVGFAIPSSYVKRIATEIISNGKGSHGYLGVGLADYTTTNSTFTSGAKLTSVTSGSAAAASGLQKGDIITGIDGKAVESALQLASIVKQDAPGTTIKITYTRNGSEKTADIKLAASDS